MQLERGKDFSLKGTNSEDAALVFPTVSAIADISLQNPTTPPKADRWVRQSEHRQALNMLPK